MKDFINKINFVASIGFAGLGLYLLIIEKSSQGWTYLLLSVFLLATVFLYSLYVFMKSQVHRSSAVLKFFKTNLNPLENQELEENKLMTLVFLSDLAMLKESNETITHSSWSWKNKNPINPLVINLLKINAVDKKIEYTLSEEEMRLLNSVLVETKQLSKIEVDILMFERFSKLLNIEEKENSVLKLKEVI